MRQKLQGIAVPLLTPFTADGEALDTVALRALVDRLVDAQVHVIIPNAGTSEFYHMDDDERRCENEVVIEQAAGRVPVIAGAGAISTRHAVAFAKHAEAAGADGVFIVPPYYSATSKSGILKHYAAISDAVSLPITIYNNPFVTGVLLTPDDLAQIVERANVGSIKLTTRLIEDIPILRDRVGDEMPIFEGWDPLGFPAMVIGADGIVTAPANVMPDVMMELWRLTSVEGNLAAAAALNKRLSRFFHYVMTHGIFHEALKEMSEWMGYPIGHVRDPFPRLNDEQRARVREFAVDFQLIPALAAA